MKLTPWCSAVSPKDFDINSEKLKLQIVVTRIDKSHPAVNNSGLQGFAVT